MQHVTRMPSLARIGRRASLRARKARRSLPRAGPSIARQTRFPALFGSDAQTYFGLAGDVHALKCEADAEFFQALSPRIRSQPGLLLHFRGKAGCLLPLSKRKSRFYDRFFLGRTVETVERRETVRDGVRPREFRSAERAGGRSEARRFIGRRLLWNRGNGGVGPAGGGENAVPSVL